MTSAVSQLSGKCLRWEIGLYARDSSTVKQTSRRVVPWFGFVTQTVRLRAR